MTVELRIQLKIPPDTRIGPGKIRLLEMIAERGSMSAAARGLGMTFRRAWDLVDHMNKAFGHPLVTGHTGAAGGAELTAFGQDVVRRFRAIEAASRAGAGDHLQALDRAIEHPAAETADPTQ